MSGPINGAAVKIRTDRPALSYEVAERNANDRKSQRFEVLFSLLKPTRTNFLT